MKKKISLYETLLRLFYYWIYKCLPWVLDILPYKQIKVTKDEIDTEYLEGDWNRVRHIEELAHFFIIVGYYDYLTPKGSILDIGCGEGILQEKLCPFKYLQYLGVDLSAEAIRCAKKKEDDKSIFISSDARSFEPENKFNMIVFNECLYYFDNPLSVLRKYEKFLEKDGFFVVSMYMKKRAMQAWRMIESVYNTYDEVKITNKLRISWLIKVFKPS